jgi:hypothetical protein
MGSRNVAPIALRGLGHVQLQRANAHIGGLKRVFTDIFKYF